MAEPAERMSMHDWQADSYLQGVAFAAIASAMAKQDLAMLSAYIRELRAKGADVERLYEAARQRHPSAPMLSELERRPGAT